MSLQIFNSIVNGELKPWLIDFDESTFKDIVRQANKMPVTNLQEVVDKLKQLLQPFNSLQKAITDTNSKEIKVQDYYCNTIEATNLLQHFYKTLIDTELIRYYNETLTNPFIKVNTLDVPFQIGEKSLKGIAVLCNQANNELIERGFADTAPFTDITHFTLTYLRNNLLALYFSIQEPFKEHLNTVYSDVQDICMYCLDNACSITLNKNAPTTDVILPKTNIKSTALYFGFKDDIEVLKKIVHTLVMRMDFLNSKKTTEEQFIQVFTSTNLKVDKIEVHIDCATNEFVEMLPYFKTLASKFTPATINKSRLFYTKEGTLIDDNLLHVTKHKSKLDPEKKDLIKAIFETNRKEKG